MHPTTKNFPLPLMLTITLLLLAMPARSMHVAQDDDLTKLTRALEMLGREQAATDAVTPEWIMATHPGILTVLDAEKRLYQIKVLQQKGASCTLHALRNSFFLLKLFDGSQSEFSKTYNQMVDEKSYEKFVEGLPKTDWCDYGITSAIPEFITPRIKSGALWAGSLELAKKMMQFYNTKNEYNLNPKEIKDGLSIATTIEKCMPTVEPDFDDPLAVAKVISLKTSPVSPFNALANSDNYNFCANISVEYAHATILLVTKQNGVISFVFANSLGSSPASDIDKAIKSIIDLAINPTRLEDAVIRVSYFNHLGAGDCKMSANDLISSLEELTEYINIKKFKQNTLFKTVYYPALKAQYEKLKGTAKNEQDQDRLNRSKKLLQDLDPSEE